MSARYLLRFDDICPTMNWRVWAEVEGVLTEHGVKPIVAVVPDNRDRALVVDTAATDFWARVRRWQASGWAVGLHGYQHLYCTADPGILRHCSRKSEFAGLPRGAQEEKLCAALQVFNREGIRPDCWVAPSHTFDDTTMALLVELGVRVISDGLWPRPRTDDHGLLWVPLQLGRFQWRPWGTWGVGQHVNRWDGEVLAAFRRSVAANARRISSLATVLDEQRAGRPTVGDAAYALLHHAWCQRVLPAAARRLGRG